MKCVLCNAEESRVIDSRVTMQGASIRRRRECLECHERFTTYEYVMNYPIVVIKKDGTREEYNRKKLYNSFRIACKKRPVPEEAILEAITFIEESFSNHAGAEIHSDEIGEKVMESLKVLDKIAFVRYASVYREFQELTDFEQQISELKE
ncbi:MAG: transcriptional repressor NrdR [Candidatus Marinimicrobia bacterium]|nr:transcriptional repressor NrdR [Candidatus Neomarinimicrobiota bacterium]